MPYVLSVPRDDGLLYVEEVAFRKTEFSSTWTEFPQQACLLHERKRAVKIAELLTLVLGEAVDVTKED